MSRTTFLKWRQGWGWPARDEAQRQAKAARAADQSAAVPVVEATVRPSRRGIAGRIRAAVDRELEAVEAALGRPGGQEAAERAARTLASLVKTLTELKRLDAGAASTEEADGGRGDLDGLRRTIAQRLAGLRGGRADR
jgi:hypothetical protein